ncbi:11861_t:CDS:2, partial [Funneliformis geosporum]
MSRQFARNSNILKAKIDNVLPNLNVLEEYSECLGKVELRQKDLDEITVLLFERKEEYFLLRNRRLNEFMHGFNLISRKLKEMYQIWPPFVMASFLALSRRKRAGKRSGGEK